MRWCEGTIRLDAEAEANNGDKAIDCPGGWSGRATADCSALRERQLEQWSTCGDASPSHRSKYLDSVGGGRGEPRSTTGEAEEQSRQRSDQAGFCFSSVVVSSCLVSGRLDYVADIVAGEVWPS